MSTPFVQTSRLSNILQMVSLARQTGILRVIRGQGATREMGQIRFIDGQPVLALLGQLTGDAALGVLDNWGECHYAFDELALAEVAGTTGALTSTGSVPVTGSPSAVDLSSLSSLSSLGVPAGGWASGAPFAPDMTSLPSYPSPTSPLSDTSWPVYGYQQSDIFSGSGGSQLGTPGVGGPFSPPGFASPHSAPASMPAMPSGPMQGTAVSTILLTTVPRRTALAEHVEHLPLDRRERMVLLLVDGQRSVVDLARLTRRADTEVQAVLTHLQLLGLITLAR